MNALNSMEIVWVRGIHDALESSFMDFIMPLITSLSDGGIFWILLALVFLIPKDTRRMGLTMGLALVIGLLVGNLGLKPLIGRIRPYDFDPSILLIIPPESEFSFPSGHSLAAFEGAMGIFLYRKRWGVPALILAALIAFSRVYLQVHYPIDIVCGSVLGAVFAWIAYRIVSRIRWKYL